MSYRSELETALHEMPGARSVARRHPRLDWSDRTCERSVVIERTTLVGSASSAELVIDDPAVSRLHAELDPRRDGLWVRDLASKNGSFVNGIRVASARVPDGGKVQLGSTLISV